MTNKTSPANLVSPEENKVFHILPAQNPLTLYLEIGPQLALGEPLFPHF